MAKRRDIDRERAEEARGKDRIVECYVNQIVIDDQGTEHRPGEVCQFTADVVERCLRPNGLVTTKRAFEARQAAEQAKEEADADLDEILAEEAQAGIPGHGQAATESGTAAADNRKKARTKQPRTKAARSKKAKARAA